MQIDSSQSTSRSLLAKIRKRDAEAWSRFATIYTPLVYGWARRAGLQDSDAADVVQDVFRIVFRKISTFQKEGQRSRFRGWLWAISRNRIRQFYRQLIGKVQAAGGTTAESRLQQIPAIVDEESDPSGDEYRRAVLHRALNLVQPNFSTSTWEAFWRVTIEGHSPAEVAADLGLSPQAVRQAKYRVLCQLREEVDGFL